MSIPYCLTNPKLRLVSTRWGLVTLERIAPQDYVIFMKGERVGRVSKMNHWRTEQRNAAYKTREQAIHAAIVEWKQALTKNAPIV